MTDSAQLAFIESDPDMIEAHEGVIAVFLPEAGKLDQLARRLNRLTKGVLARFSDSAVFAGMKEGDAHKLSFPTGLAADTILVIRLERRTRGEVARKAGAKIGQHLKGKNALVLAAQMKGAGDIALGAMLRAYEFTAHKSPKSGDRVEPANLHIMSSRPEEFQDQKQIIDARVNGTFLTRDLVNEPSNVLTTVAFAERLEALRGHGLDVKVLEETELEKLGMRTLLAVGMGSETPSKVVVMEWKGGGDEPPLALLGKGVVFDTGGISMKPAAGMEAMTMDMGGAATVAGVMQTLALRKSKANVVGIVGLVENMPDGRAQRPGDVVRSMKGDTVEVINTDAEGRLVLCDVLWFAQETYAPAAIIDLATLTGAVIVALGHTKAGVFSNDDAFASDFLKAAGSEGEGAWQLPLGEAYDKALKSRIADMKNVGGRAGGAIIAAQFLKRFVKDDVPWIHLDIAGVASVGEGTDLAPKGATGWGVLALDRLVADRFET